MSGETAVEYGLIDSVLDQRADPFTGRMPGREQRHAQSV